MIHRVHRDQAGAHIDRDPQAAGHDQEGDERVEGERERPSRLFAIAARWAVERPVSIVSAICPLNRMSVKGSEAPRPSGNAMQTTASERASVSERSGLGRNIDAPCAGAELLRRTAIAGRRETRSRKECHPRHRQGQQPAGEDGWREPRQCEAEELLVVQAVGVASARSRVLEPDGDHGLR